MNLLIRNRDRRGFTLINIGLSITTHFSDSITTLHGAGSFRNSARRHRRLVLIEKKKKKIVDQAISTNGRFETDALMCFRLPHYREIHPVRRWGAFCDLEGEFLRYVYASISKIESAYCVYVYKTSCDEWKWWKIENWMKWKMITNIFITTIKFFSIKSLKVSILTIFVSKFLDRFC